MEKKILIVVNDNDVSKQLLDYTVNISSMIPQLYFTIMNVQPPISQFMTDEAKRDAKIYTQLHTVKRKNQKAAERILEACRDRLVRMGVPKDHIDLFTQPKKLGVARDILDKAENGLYDALLVGRRGLTKTQQIFMGSVSNKIVNNAVNVPVWIVDGEVTSMKILIAVDGSAASLRSVDHLSFMVGGNPKVEVTLFHVTPKLGDFCTINFDEDPAEGLEEIFLETEQRCIDNFYAQAQKMLLGVGLTETQVKIKTKTTAWSVSKAIREEASVGGYGTVVIGRSGMNKSFFMGNTSSRVIQSLANCALWITA